MSDEGFIYHGGDLAAARARFGGAAEDWLDLSTGINPRPYPVSDLPAEAWTQLPQPDAEERLLAAARNAYDLPACAGIAAAPGTQALIQLLPTLLSPRRVAIVAPTYGEHAPAWRAAGHDVREVREPVSDTDVLVLCSPNNPDGRLADPALLEWTGEGRLLVVDEAFADVTPEASLTPHAGLKGLLILRSFGKFYGLAGLRLGFAVGDPALTRVLAARLGPWAVSGPALEIGAAALADTDWQAEGRAYLQQASARLDDLLHRAGLHVVGGTSLFRLAETPGPAAAWHEHLACAHIWTRPFPDHSRWLRFGLPGSEHAWQRLAAALAATNAQAAE
jgi:cobalamin biosynthesis protein CobC